MSVSEAPERFCDFCDCPDCRDGAEHLSHAATADGKHICSTCYWYERCIDAKRDAGEHGGPCENEHCDHRPKLVGPWIKFEGQP